MVGDDAGVAPNASISRTICPLATPPMAGLHDICAIVFMFIVTNSTFDPILAAATAASQPACPAPTTMTSYSGNIPFSNLEPQIYTIAGIYAY